ncbi:uncharacterized MFS-type transporter C09D4.1-like isoform X2 [Macrosteles quadrilineatus]|uniref:uncharacterized MFS-type transporter C09D4.1-like isoform X2 n=1 Tax=Macrosteles quadrilineatus TaxID=74068 RepID=UPI0023E2932C|nr:uncharacterized MFS-type transporter C09D4.1-like isoform X2 [Macrosteles quadrilineatus]
MTSAEQALKGAPVMGEHCRVYRRRWLVLTLFALCSCANAAHWIQYSIIANVCMYYYDVSAIYINWTSMIFMAVYIPLVFPASWILERKGLRVAVILGALLMCVGAWIKVFSAQPDRFALTFLGQTMVGVAQMFTLGVPSRLAAVWFPAHQVSTACAIGVFGNQLGIAIGFLVPPAIVDDVKDKFLIGEQLQLLYFGMALAPTIVLILIVLLFEAQPPIPPSVAQLISRKKEREGKDTNYLTSVKQVIGNSDFSLLLVSFGFNIGVFYAYSTLLNQQLEGLPWGFENAGRVGLTLILGGMVGSVVWGVVLDKTHMYKETTVGIYIMAVIGMLGYTFALHSERLALVYFTSAFLGFFMNGYLTVGYEFGAELTFPHAETTSSGLLNAVGELFGVAAVLVAGVVLETYGPTATNLALTAVLAGGLVTLAPISRDRLQRLAASRVHPEDSTMNDFQI